MIDVDLEVEAEDLKTQDELLARFDQIAARYFRPAARYALDQIERGWRSEAPLATGAYVDSIGGRIERVVGMEVKGIVSTSVRKNGGFPYPAALETSKRYTFRVSGRPSRGTMRRMLKSKGEAIMQRFWHALEATVRDLVVH